MIEVNNLIKHFGNVTAVNNISFQVGCGEIVGFLGPNGAGKTTTMRILTCYLTPTDGDIRVCGYSPQNDSYDIRKRIGYLPENNPLYEDMNVLEYLSYIAELHLVPKNLILHRIKEVVNMCGLNDVITRQIHELSKGYKQRVGFAQTLIHDPDILILDEPTSGLDPNQAREIRELIKTLKQNKTIILSTHILSEVQAIADRVLIINNGVIAADGTKEELKTMVQGKEIINIILEAPEKESVKLISGLDGVESVEIIGKHGKNETALKITVRQHKDIRKEIFNSIVEKKWTLLEMHKQVIDLEDIFRMLTT